MEQLLLPRSIKTSRCASGRRPTGRSWCSDRARGHDDAPAAFRAVRECGFSPRPTPKVGEYDRCTGCGRCILGDGHIVSSYFDYLSFFFDRRWRHSSGNIYSIMIKLADTNQGAVRGRRIVKTLTDKDREKLDEAVELCADLLGGLGVRRRDIFLGTVNAGHPGGTMPLTGEEASSLHHSRLPENLYIADATLLPGPLGNPPIFTIMALAKRVSKICINGKSGRGRDPS